MQCKKGFQQLVNREGHISVLIVNIMQSFRNPLERTTRHLWHVKFNNVFYLVGGVKKRYTFIIPYKWIYESCFRLLWQCLLLRRYLTRFNLRCVYANNSQYRVPKASINLLSMKCPKNRSELANMYLRMRDWDRWKTSNLSIIRVLQIKQRRFEPWRRIHKTKTEARETGD